MALNTRPMSQSDTGEGFSSCEKRCTVFNCVSNGAGAQTIVVHAATQANLQGQKQNHKTHNADAECNQNGTTQQASMHDSIKWEKVAVLGRRAEEEGMQI